MVMVEKGSRKKEEELNRTFHFERRAPMMGVNEETRRVYAKRKGLPRYGLSLFIKNTINTVAEKTL